jgi:glucans biosynthesis protein
VVATRIGRAGIPGATQWPANARKFALDFEGGALAADAGALRHHAGGHRLQRQAVNAYVTKLVGTDRWRALFDVPVDGKAPVDLRCYLKLGDKTLSETWIYQYFA